MQLPSGAYGGYGDSGQTQEAVTEPSYTVAETDVYRMIPRDTMTIEISVDELDVRSLHVGQEAEVTLDALPGQSFPATIVSMDADGSYEEGNTKYTVKVSLDRTEQMLSGMNAGVKVALGDPARCTAIPEAALVEQSGKTYVYTVYDAQHDLLSGLTEVETGVSDGTNVEIVSGLQQGLPGTRVQGIFPEHQSLISSCFFAGISATWQSVM